MIPFPRLVFLGALLAGLARPAPFAVAQGVAYELRPPSQGGVSCPVCNLPSGASLPNPLRGTFLLTPEEPGPEGGMLFKLTEIKIQGYAGSGTYRRGTEDPPSQEMTLDVDSGGERILFSGSGVSSRAARWPVIDIQVWNPPEEFWSHAIHLVAAPATQYVEYALGPGSQYAVQCQDCIPPLGAWPLGGKFLLGKIAPGDPEVFRIEVLEFRNTLGSEDWRFAGEGAYALSQGGASQEVDFLLRGSGMSPWGLSLLMQGRGPPAAQLPELDLELAYRDQLDPQRVLFSLRLVGSPSTEAPFRRGDADGDGQLDISDPVLVLAWRFLGGREPACLEAAESNGDSRHDLADPVILLSFLFLGAEPPPFPGPGRCGLTQEPVFGCGANPGCR